VTYVIALLACHNRKERTVACLTSLFDQDVTGGGVEAILVDDGSSDGTAEAVRDLSDRVEVVRTDGSLYWARSMALAEERAVARDPDFLLWLNDDVVLLPRALEVLLETHNATPDPQIVVGSTVDAETRRATYGGMDRADWHPLRFELVAPTDGEAVHCDTFNGNVVLVPRAIYTSVGGIDGNFAHAYADNDYGLRARALGFFSIVAGNPVGTCSRGPAVPWADESLSLIARYRLMSGRKGIPAGSSVRYLRRHGGRAWPLFFAATYVKVAMMHMRARMRRLARRVTHTFCPRVRRGA
jgi:GT2 family glycosyltransferase